METRKGPTSKLCDWVYSTRYEDIPGEVRKATLTLLYDQIGCMVASATLPSCQPLVDLVRSLSSSGECTIVGHPVRTSVLNAALANGTIGHGDEVDSSTGQLATGQNSKGGYAATIVPTALSVGQYVGASGKEFLRGLALGSEITARFMSVLGHYRSRNRFRQNIGGSMGAAVTAGLLLGLDTQKLESALGLAASGACGLPNHNLEELHQIKSLNHGMAAEAGVLSALLARQDFHGPREVLTIENGFFDVFLGLAEAGHEVIDGLGEAYLMREIAYKRYSAGAPAQAILYSFFQLLKKHNLTDEDIVQIEVPVAIRSDASRHPSLHMETILSLAAVYGELTFMHVHNPSYRESPRLRTFQERARILAVPVTPEQRLETGITVKTCNGNVLRHELIYPSMTDQEIQHKFQELVGLRLDRSSVVDLETKLGAIETCKNVAPLVSDLELDY